MQLPVNGLHSPRGLQPGRRWMDWALVASCVVTLLLLARICFPGRSLVRGGAGRPIGSEAISVATSSSSHTSPRSGATAGIEGSRLGASADPRLGIWSRLVSTNWIDFAAHLRDAGCPPETVCDLIRPLIERSYLERQSKARQVGDFWATGARRRENRRKSESEIRRLDEEKDRWLGQLACPPEVHESHDLDFQFILGVVTDKWPRERGNALMKLVERAEKRRRDWQERTHGVLRPEDLESIQREIAGFRAEFDALLSPADQEELGLRVAWVAEHFFRDSESRLESLKLTPAELREFSRIEKGHEPDVVISALTFRELLGESPAETQERDGERARRLRALLGEERYAELVKSEDEAFVQATQWEQSQNQPAGLAQRVHEVLAEFQQAVPALREAWETDPEAGRTALRQRRDEVLARLEQMLENVPAKERDGAAKNWVDSALRRKWRSP